jgi:hypothetical protein
LVARVGAWGLNRPTEGSKKSKKWQKGQMAFFCPFATFCLFCFSFRAKESAERIAGDKGFAKALVARLAVLDSLAIGLLISLLLVIVYRLVAQG